MPPCCAVDDLIMGLADLEPVVRNKCASALNELETMVPLDALDAVPAIE